MEVGFGLVVVMVVDYATGLLSYNDRRYFLGVWWSCRYLTLLHFAVTTGGTGVSSDTVDFGPCQVLLLLGQIEGL